MLPCKAEMPRALGGCWAAISSDGDVPRRPASCRMRRLQCPGGWPRSRTSRGSFSRAP